MSITYTYDGAPVTHDAAPGGLNITHRADGEASFGGIPFKDPDASLVVVGHKLVTVEEDECAQPRLFTGFTTERGMGRSLDEGLFVGASPRLVDMTVVDMNAALGFRQITGSDGNRPAETWAARLTWILESDYLNEFISADQTWIVTNTVSIEAADYRDAYATAVLDDLVDRSGGAYVYYAFWDAVASEVRLFFDNDNEVIGACTLSISNVDADVDGATVFAPTSTSKLAREPDQTYSDVTVVYDRGAQRVHRHRPSTAAAYVRRGTEISRPYTRGLATATAQAEKWLDKHADEVDRITCSIQVPAASVGLIQAGQSIDVKLTHLGAPYTSFTTMRIVSYSPKPANDLADLYDIGLELVGASSVTPATVPSTLVAFSFAQSTNATEYGFPIADEWSSVLGESGGGAAPAAPGIGLWSNDAASGTAYIFSTDGWGSAWVGEFGFSTLGTVTEHTGYADTSDPHTLAFTADGPGLILVAYSQSHLDDPSLLHPSPTTADFVELWNPNRIGRELAAISVGYLPVDTAGSYDITWDTANAFDWKWTALGVFLPAGVYIQSAGAQNDADGGDLTVTLADDPSGYIPDDDVTDLGPTPGATTTHATDPTVTDDAAAGYTVGSNWINTTTGHEFVLVDSTTGAAVWVSTTAVSVFSFSTSDGTTTVDPTTELTFVGGTLADLGGGVAELTLTGINAVTNIDGGKEVVSTVAAAGATETLDLADGNVHDVTLDEDCTLTFAGATAGVACSFTLLLRQDGTGGWTTTWPGSVVWAGGTAPTLDETASTVAVLTFFTLDGGTVWYGFPTGGGGTTIDPATTVTDETTWGITPAVGSDTEYARQDHTHGTPAQPATGVGELLITDTPAGSPLVFDDILQNDAGTALLYAD